MASEFQNQFQEAMREAELADLKKEVDDMTAQGAELRQLRSARATSARSSRSTQQPIESAIADKPPADVAERSRRRGSPRRLPARLRAETGGGRSRRSTAAPVAAPR